MYLYRLLLQLFLYLQKNFELHTLNFTQWIITIVISFMPIPIMELQKLANKDKIIKRNIHNLNYKKGETI